MLSFYSHLNCRFHWTAACKPSPLKRVSCRTFLQTVYKPSTNRPTNRARRLGNSHKPYKPYTRGGCFPTPQIVTVCTVCGNSRGQVHGLWNGLWTVRTVCGMTGKCVHCRRARRSCGVQRTAASFFLLAPPYGGHVLPQSRARPLGGGNCECSCEPHLKVQPF